MDAAVDVAIPFSEASLWAMSLRRLRLVAELSGVTGIPGPQPYRVGGEHGFEDWGADDKAMFEPLLYALRNARRAIDTCNGEACDAARALRPKVLYWEKEVCHWKIRPTNIPRIPDVWLPVFQLFWPEVRIHGKSAETQAEGLADVLAKIGPGMVRLEPKSKNGAFIPEIGFTTCDVDVPSNLSATASSPWVELSTGVKMPLLGLGTGDAFWEVPGVTDREDAPVGFGYPPDENKTAVQLNQEACVKAVLWAFEAGFRGVDTAEDYGTERCVGEALKRLSEVGLTRNDIFIATKLSTGEGRKTAPQDQVSHVLDRSFMHLGMWKDEAGNRKDAHVDLYLQHHPWDGSRAMVAIWGQMEKELARERVKVLGGASHGPGLIERLHEQAQVEGPAVMYEKWDVFHRGSGDERAIRKTEKERGVKIVATGPIHGTPFELSCFLDPIVKSVAKRLQRTPAQICLRYCLQNGLAVIPKSRHKSRLKENAAIFDFEIPDSDMQILNGLSHALIRFPRQTSMTRDALGYYIPKADLAKKYPSDTVQRDAKPNAQETEAQRTVMPDIREASKAEADPKSGTTSREEAHDRPKSRTGKPSREEAHALYQGSWKKSEERKKKREEL